MSDQKPGFLIDGRHYAFPAAFRLGDPVLIAELTGLSFPEFCLALDDPDRRSDPVVMIGLIGVAVWQANPRWRRDRVVAFVQEIDLNGFETLAGEDEEAQDGDPPAEPAETPAPSPVSPATSSGSRD